MPQPDPDPIAKSLAVAATTIQQYKPTPTHQMALYLIQSLERHLELAKTATELKSGRDWARLFAVYFARHRENLKDANAFRAAQLRMDRKLGSILAETPREPGTSSSRLTRYQSLLEELEISRQTAGTWQKLAQIEKDEFDQWLLLQQKDGTELTTRAAMEYWREYYAPDIVDDGEGYAAEPKGEGPENFPEDQMYPDFGSRMRGLLNQCQDAHDEAARRHPDLAGLFADIDKAIIALFEEMKHE